MLKKIIKHEWYGVRKVYLILCGILLLSTLLCYLTNSLNPERLDSNISAGKVLGFAFSLIYYYMCILICSLGVIIVFAKRFYNTCYTDQGYLTHTLPVSPHELLAGKILVAFLGVLFEYILLLVSVIALFTGYNNILGAYVIKVIGVEINEMISNISFSGILYAIATIVIILLSILRIILIIFTSISLSQRFTKHNLLIGILIYFAFNFVLGQSVLFKTVWLESNLESLNINGANIWITMIFKLLIVLLTCGILYYINYHSITKKLNLS